MTAHAASTAPRAPQVVAEPLLEPAMDGLATPPWTLIAHDLNNLLQAATAALGLVRQRGAVLASGTPLLDAAETALRHGAAMTRTLLSPMPEDHATAFDPAELAASMRGLLAHGVAPQACVQVQAYPGTGRIRGDRNALQRALLNLVVNAREACGGDGVIRISNGRRYLPPRLAAHHQPGHYLTLEVSDNGSGIAPAMCARLFECQTSSKHESGHGLGLAQVREAVRQAGGFIEVATTPGAGSRFVLAFPRLDDGS